MIYKEHLALGAFAAAAYLVIEYTKRREHRKTTWTASNDWEVKRTKVLSASANDLIVITDFDATVTTGDSEQCHDVMGTSPHIDAGFRKEFAPLMDWTTNTSIDGVPWWDTAHELMIKYGTPTRAIIPRLVREAKMVPRPGALELLKRLEELNVPVLIVSAGISDVIEEFLRQHGALSENVTVCSNRLNYAGDSTPKSVSPSPPITSFTKEYAYSSASSFFSEHQNRRSILQLGDSVTDVDPARHVPYDRLLSVGFVNERPDPTKHYEAFDAVVHGNNGSLLPVTDLLEEMAPTPTIIRAMSKMGRSVSYSLLGPKTLSYTAPAA